MKRTIILSLLVMICISCNSKKEESKVVDSSIIVDQKQIENEIWSVIETKFNSWRDNDFEKHMQTFHSDWKRWAHGKNKFLTKKTFKNFWDEAKKNEEVIKMAVTPVEFRVLEGGKAALVHYTSNEVFKRIGPDVEIFKQGVTYEGTRRWSDMFIKENGKWLCVGGHKDGTFPERDADLTPIDTVEVGPIEKEIWGEIENRFYAWRDNDLEKFIGTHHSKYKRWSLSKDELQTKETMRAFWKGMKDGEEVLAMEVTPVEFRILEGGNAAIVYYTCTETFKRTGPSTQMFKQGETYKGILRWNDMFVKENDRWLFIGGYRDVSFPEEMPKEISVD